MMINRELFNQIVDAADDDHAEPTPEKLRRIEELRARGRDILGAIRTKTEEAMPWLKEK